MQIESITALAFGPFKGKSLELARGLTVIHGPNESGKSTWHAALYAGICGVRRGPGVRRDAQYFRERHQPWDGEDWEVSLIARLEDGRRVELRHDLAGRVACEARDADLGRDYSSEIMFEGNPDGSRWLGLDRMSFLSTACVRQADIQAVKDQAGALQEHLQRAAATAGTDATAATAIAKLGGFLRNSVGTERRNSTRPLRSAMDDLRDAEARLEEAKSIHIQYMDLYDELEQLQISRDAALYSLRLVQLVQARHSADSVKMEADRARELTNRHPKEPLDLSELRQQIQTVGNALSIWDTQPDIVPASSPTSEEIRGEIRGLPPMPDGDTKPHRDVVEAMNALRNARSNLETHQGRKPPQPQNVVTGNLTSQEVRNLASELALEEPEVDPALDKRVQDAQARLEAIRQPGTQQHSSRDTFLLLRPFIGFFRILANLFRRLFGGRKPKVDYEAIAAASEELREAQNAQGEARFNRDTVRRRKQEARDKAAEAGLPTDMEELLRIGELVDELTKARNEITHWESEDVRLHQACDEAEDKLRQALENRGVSSERDSVMAAERYMSDCEQRDSQAQQASRRSELERLLARTLEQEATLADSSQKKRQASQNIAEVALAVDRSADSEEALVDTLRLWYSEAEQLLQEREKAREEWRELQKLLNSRNIDDLENSAEDRRREAEQMAVGIDEESIGLVDQDEDLEKLLDQYQKKVEETQTALATKQGQFEHFSRDIPVVAEAEEKVDVAKAELSRVTTLRDTLNKTSELLVSAQDRVHRSLAPVLRDALKPWLSDVTQGRYQDIRVDVESLEIKVSGDGRRWREANLLSHGTTEQIYLLLRVVMSRYLTKNDEICPLILDDVTVNCDMDRQKEILSLLHSISREQQVILFSQEPETLEWAQEHLSNERDSLILLDPSLAPP